MILASGISLITTSYDRDEVLEVRFSEIWIIRQEIRVGVVEV
jgi:hypothetical protein